MNSRPLIIYHGSCVDGFTAAWAAWLRYGDDADYHAAYFGKPPPDVQDRYVSIFDFSYPRGELAEMSRRAAYLVLYDHHKTAQEKLGDLPFCYFDMDRSGARLAWSYFWSRAAQHGDPVPRVELPGWRETPWLIDYVEDRDLWRNALPGTEEVNALVGVTPMNFEAWTELAMMNFSDAREQGSFILRARKNYTQSMVSCARQLPFCEFDSVPVVNAPWWGISELLNALCQDAPLAVGWFQRDDGLYHYSLRSREVDVGAIAAAFGGGGHKNASGFVADEPFDRLIWR